MTLDLVFHGAPTRATHTLEQLAHDLGLAVDLVGERSEGMEIFSVSVLTVQLTGEPQSLDAAGRWFARRGIHRLAA